MDPNAPKNNASQWHIVWSCETDVGRVRGNNEDAVIAADLTSDRISEKTAETLRWPTGQRGLLFAVSDGMGGANAGEYASNIAVQSLALKLFGDGSVEPDEQMLHSTVQEANEAIKKMGQEFPERRGMGATLTAVLVQQDHALIGQIGDSRCYLLRAGALNQVTRDQSLVQNFIDAGVMSKEQAAQSKYRNIILQALGTGEAVELAVTRLELQDGDRLLICSDGLSGKVSDEEMLRILTGSYDAPADACRQLVDLANANGGEDNITVLVAGAEKSD